MSRRPHRKVDLRIFTHCLPPLYLPGSRHSHQSGDLSAGPGRRLPPGRPAANTRRQKFGRRRLRCRRSVRRHGEGREISHPRRVGVRQGGSRHCAGLHSGPAGGQH